MIAGVGKKRHGDTLLDHTLESAELIDDQLSLDKN
jgi:hypothetical protein